MEFRLVLAGKVWQARYVQSGSPTGWSEWSYMDRQDALHRIERGFTFTTIDVDYV